MCHDSNVFLCQCWVSFLYHLRLTLFCRNAFNYADNIASSLELHKTLYALKENPVTYKETFWFSVNVTSMSTDRTLPESV